AATAGTRPLGPRPAAGRARGGRAPWTRRPARVHLQLPRGDGGVVAGAHRARLIPGSVGPRPAPLERRLGGSGTAPSTVGARPRRAQSALAGSTSRTRIPRGESTDGRSPFTAGAP